MFYFEKFCDKNFNYEVLWLVNWPGFTNIEWSIVVLAMLFTYGFLRIISNMNCAHFWKKNFEIFIAKYK